MSTGKWSEPGEQGWLSKAYVATIQERVAKHFRIHISDIYSGRRSAAFALPRQTAMYLARQMTACSLAEIGKLFGNRDHTTVMHAVEHVADLMSRDRLFAGEVELLRLRIELDMGKREAA